MRISCSVGNILSNPAFPLKISSNSRYFTTATGQPFFIVHDAGWLASIQLNFAQIDQYLNDRAARGFTGIIYQMNGVPTSSQTPNYNDQAGFPPFNTMTDAGAPTYTPVTIDFSTSNTNYLQYIDYFVQGCYKRSLALIFFPDYWGFPGASPPEGFGAATQADTAAHLQAFGAMLANRYGSYGHIIWGLAGDNSLSQSDLDQQWNIVTGMRSVRTDQLIYVKGQRNTSGYSLLTTDGGTSRYLGFNVNNAYIANGSGGNYTQISDCVAEYARSGPLPFFVDEGDYELSGITDNDVRLALWGPALAGACGVSFGNEYLYGFGGAFNNGFSAGGPSSALTPTYLATNGSAAAQVCSTWIQRYHWELLVPQGFLTSSRGSGASAIQDATASDGSFVMVYTSAGTGFTGNMTALTHSSVRARWLDPTNGATTTDAASPLPNTGTHTFAIPTTNSLGASDWVLILD